MARTCMTPVLGFEFLMAGAGAVAMTSDSLVSLAPYCFSLSFMHVGVLEVFL